MLRVACPHNRALSVVMVPVDRCGQRPKLVAGVGLPALGLPSAESRRDLTTPTSAHMTEKKDEKEAAETHDTRQEEVERGRTQKPQTFVLSG